MNGYYVSASTLCMYVCVRVCMYKSCKCAIASEVRLMYEAWLSLNAVYTE